MLNHLVAPAFLLAVALGVSSCKEDTITPQTYGTITGVVLSADTRTALAGANISTNPPTVSVLTDMAGTFTITNVPVGNYAVFASLTGYKKSSASVAVSEGAAASAAVLLERSTSSGPTTPANPVPQNQSIGQATSLSLAWSSTIADPADTVKFDVLLYESGSSSQTLAASAIKDTVTTVQGLKYGVVYYWQVIAKDLDGNVVNGPLWSFTTRVLPDYHIVFARLQDGNYDIFSTDSLGSAPVRLTASPARDWWPRLSPRHDRIAFSSDGGVEPQIFTVGRDGSGLFQVTSQSVSGSRNHGIGFSWSPDGGYLLYSHYDKLYRIDATGSNLTLIAGAPMNRHWLECEWSALGDKIIVSTVGTTNLYDGEIYVMDANGANMVQVVGNVGGVIGSPSFSVDGKSIMYTQDLSGFESPDGRQLNAHIILKRLNGTDSLDLSLEKPDGTNDLHPRFSPDGAHVVFENAPNDGSAPGDLWMLDAHNGARKKVLSNAIMPDWH